MTISRSSVSTDAGMMSAVTCSNCGTPNPAGQKFCGECGSALPLLCPACGAPVTATQKFCGECATPLKAAAAPTVRPEVAPPARPSARPAPAPTPPVAPLSTAPAEERRLVTALFCDLVGFTPLSAQLDPEEVRDIQAAYFDQMSAQIERYGGTVEKYAGDAVLALFGAPIAHEDDAERAVLCALGMQRAIDPVAAHAKERWDVQPAIRVGVNTGEVVSGTWSASGRQDVAVSGDAVNTAARIQAAAEPGEVLVGTETMRLTRRRIRYGERRDLVLKGKAGTVPAYPAVGLREHFGERWETEAATPLVGRDREMVELLDAWVRTQAGEGQLVTVIGDAGVGKSRLISELLEKVTASAAVRVIRARCLSYGQQISLWLIADLLRSTLGIREQDVLDEVGAKLQVAVAGLLAGADDETRAEALDVVGEALGLPPGNSMVANAGPQIRRQALIRSLRLVVGALSERAPTVVVLEDLHWIDEASQDVLKEVVSDVPGLRVLVLAAQRPGWNAPWSEWGWTERITLRPLRDQDAAILAGAVLGGLTLSPELEQYVAERAGGNPFFVEEMLRALEETGGLEQRNGAMSLVQGAAERLPSTLTEVLLARLDRLDGQPRSVAQVASVIGRSFAVRLLAQVMEWETAALEMPLTVLQQAEIAFPRRGSDPEYVFKHVSMREVAYNTLVQKRRQQLHLQTARAIASLYPSDEYVEIIAYHYAKTEEHQEAAEWLERAGDRAAAIYSSHTAIANYEEARRRLALVEREEAPTRLEEKLGGVLLSAGRYDEAIPILERAVGAYRQARDLEGAGRATALLGRTHRLRGTPEEGIALVEQMVELLTWSGPSQALASLYVALSHLFFLTGRYREQAAVAERAGEIARAVGDDRLLGEAEMRRGTALTQLGRVEEGRRAMEGALPLVQAGGDLDTLFLTLNNLGVASERLGQMEQMQRYTEQALALTERIGNPSALCFMLGNLGSTLAMLGDWQGAREALERGVGLARTIGRSADVTNPLLNLGDLLLWKGEWEEASRYLDEAFAVTEETGDRLLRENVQARLAELDVLEGRSEAAVKRLEPLVAREDAELGALLPILAWAYLTMDDGESLERAEEVAEQAVTRGQEQPGFLVHALRVQGMVFDRLGRFDEAERVLGEGSELARALPFPYAEARILFEMGMMYVRRGEATQAQERLDEALAIFERLGARKDVERTEQALAELVPAR